MFYADIPEDEVYKDEFVSIKRKEREAIRYTEEILNSGDRWVDINGQVHKLEDMSEDYLRNVLRFIYRNRTSYWLNCYNTHLIDKFKDGDDFFQRVIRNSPLWKGILDQLGSEKNLKFEFPIEL